MVQIRNRIDFWRAVEVIPSYENARAEVLALQCRTIIESIAFSCAVAVHNQSGSIPRGIAGSWSAKDVLEQLSKSHPDAFPKAVSIRPRNSNDTAGKGAKFLIEPIKVAITSYQDLIQIYLGVDPWLHQGSVYVKAKKRLKNARTFAQLKNDLEKLEELMNSHEIVIGGLGLFCVLKDKFDGQTKFFTANFKQPE